jgi:hypothetical protein
MPCFAKNRMPEGFKIREIRIDSSVPEIEDFKATFRELFPPQIFFSRTTNESA